MKKEELNKLDLKREERKERLKSIEEQLANNINEREKHKELLVSLKVNSATLEGNLQGQKAQLSSKEFEIKEKNLKINELQSGIITNKENIKTLTQEINKKSNGLKTIEERVIELENIFKEDEVLKVKIKDEYRVKETHANEIIEAIRIDEVELNKRAIQYAKIESEQESLYNRLNSELNLTLAEAKKIALDVYDVNELKNEISN